MLWTVTHPHFLPIINELGTYLLSYVQIGVFSKCVDPMLVRHLGYGVCSCLSSRYDITGYQVYGKITHVRREVGMDSGLCGG